MDFHPIKVEIYGSGCKLLNYYNLHHSPAYVFPHESTRDSWLPKSSYIPPKDPKISKSNYQYSELYNTREQYIHESKKQKAPCYSFGKAGMNNNNQLRPKSAKYKNIKFGEEELKGDSSGNINDVKNNKNKSNNNNNESEPYHQYYEIGKQFVNESNQNKAPLYSFAAGSFGTKYQTESRIDKNYKPEHDFYEVRESYVKESKKPKILGYSFGKQKRLDANIKKKWIYKTYNKNNDKNNKNDFKEEKEFKKGDNIIIPKEEPEKVDKNKNKKKENTKLNISKDTPHDYYHLREQYINESQKPRILWYSFGKKSGVQPIVIEGKKGRETFFYEINDHYINESQKPKSPKYSFSKASRKFFEKPKPSKNFRKKRKKTNTPGPASYDIRGNLGDNSLKYSMPVSGRKYAKGNKVPGPGKYYPDFNVVKKRYPIYSIGMEERDICEYPIHYYQKYRKRLSYGKQYYRRNPTWIFSKACKGEELHNKVLKDNLRYFHK